MADYTLSVVGNADMGDVISELRQIRDELHDVSESAGKAGGGFSVWKGALADLASNAVMSGLNAVKNAVSGIANGLLDIGKAAYSMGADLEQNIGGAETLYGDAADEVQRMANAASAYGVNMNDYLSMTNSYAAALKQSFGDAEDAEMQAAKAADLAIKDMADNSAKMGTELSSIQNAYAGFAKGNYTMLDNLKLGYGGTKSEMERLLADAEELSGVHYDLDNLADVYSAIHVIQENLGLTGVAADEAVSTMSGSMGRLKSVWENTLGDLAMGKDLTDDIENLKDSVTAVAKNMIPTIKNIVQSLPSLIDGVLDVGGELLSSLFSDIDPAQVADDVIHIAETLANGISENLPKLLSFGAEFIGVIGEKLFTAVTTGIHSMFQKFSEQKSNIADKLHSFISDTIGGIASYLTEHGDEILSDVLGFLGDAAGIAVKLLGYMVEALLHVDWLELGASLLKGLVEGIGSILSSLWDAFKELFESAAPGALQGLLELPVKIIAFFDELILSIIGKGAELMRGLADGIGTKVGEIKDWIAEKVGDAVSFFVDLPGKALQWGKDMISGFFDGINDAWNWMKGGINDIAGWIDDHLGFSVPKEGPLSDFDKSGSDMIKLFADGVRSEKGYLFRTVNGVASGISDSLGGMSIRGITGASARAAYSTRGNSNTYNYGGISMTVNGAQGQSEDYLAERVIDIIEARLRSEGAVFA